MKNALLPLLLASLPPLRTCQVWAGCCAFGRVSWWVGETVIAAASSSRGTTACRSASRISCSSCCTPPTRLLVVPREARGLRQPSAGSICLLPQAELRQEGGGGIRRRKGRGSPGHQSSLLAHIHGHIVPMLTIDDDLHLSASARPGFGVGFGIAVARVARATPIRAKGRDCRLC